MTSLTLRNIHKAQSAAAPASLSDPERSFGLEVEHLRECSIVRPVGTLGTCGWSPRAWQVAVVESDPIEDFLLANPKWRCHEDRLWLARAS